jgi:hypothetical protein
MSDFLTRRTRQAVTLNVAIGLVQSEPNLVDQLIAREGVEGKIDAEEMVTILEELKL